MTCDLCLSVESPAIEERPRGNNEAIADDKDDGHDVHLGLTEGAQRLDRHNFGESAARSWVRVAGRDDDARHPTISRLRN